MSVNKVILIGNTGRDAETRDLGNGVKVASVALATSESYKDKNGEKKERTEWHNLVFWRGLADVVEKYVVKGSKIYVEGRIRTEEYTDKDGVKKYATKIHVDQMTMLGSPKTDNYAGNPQGKASNFTVDDSDGNDLPF